MNQDQFLGVLKIIVPAAVGWAAGKGYIPAGSAGDIGTLVLTIAASAWSIMAHTDSAKIAAVKALGESNTAAAGALITAVTDLPDVKKVITVPNPTNSAVKAAAQDIMQTKVTPAI